MHTWSAPYVFCGGVAKHTPRGVAWRGATRHHSATPPASCTRTIDIIIMGIDSANAYFPFLQLPRELRDQIYNYVFSIPDSRGDRALRIERRHLKHFKPSVSSIILVLHHEYFLLNRQVCREALEVLFKNHSIFLSGGPYVLKQLLARIEHKGGPFKQYLRWIKQIELDWVTFPNLRAYPPERSEGRDEWWWEADNHEVDVDYIRGAQYSGYYDEHDYEGGYYDDNFYEAEDESLYPNWPEPASRPGPSAGDVFGFSSLYPFTDPSREPDYDVAATNDIETKLDLLISMEVTPLFDYLATPTFTISSIALPLYFISKQSYHGRNISRPGYALPLKIRYWVQVCVHALLMLHNSSTSLSSSPNLQEVRIKYMPWDIWASMDPTDDLSRMVDKGIWFRPGEDHNNEREREGEAFRAVWATLQDTYGLCKGKDRMGLRADIRFVKWEGDLDKWRVGDELEVVFTKSGTIS
ncbi:unnamed protein product [Periconia digitata]|uniref:Uncharacterized protein n=1 Tax=Periconia digitata TaxID=1303443 RepID=A0A9W4UAV8_9PLEO|nr:unnamed protein product [Periconia digitata]